MRLLKFSGYLFILLLTMTALVLGLGSRLPVEHTAVASAVVQAAPEKVWALVTDVAAQPGWRTGLRSVEPLPPGPEGPCWRELQRSMAMPLCVVTSEPPKLRQVRINDPQLPFGGSWTYELESMSPSATRVTITEHGTTGPPMWRFVGHYVLGEDAMIKQFLKDLQRAAPPTH